MINAMLIISILLVVLNVGITIWRKRELPKSISAMVYDLPEGQSRWLWTIWLWAVSLLMAPSLIEALPTTWQFVGFLTIACLVFCAAVPIFEKENKTIHNILGVAACVLSQICVGLICPWWLLLWLLMVAVCVHALIAKEYPRWLQGKGIFIAEAVCWMSTMAAIIFH